MLAVACIKSCFVMVVLAACEPKRNTTLNNSAPIMQASKQMSTRCIGRYLIDLPIDLAITPYGGQTIDEVVLTVSPASIDEFKSFHAKRNAELQSAVVVADKDNYPALRHVSPLPNGMIGSLFDSAVVGGNAGRMDRILEVITWKDGYMIKGEIPATDMGFPEDQANEAVQTYLKSNVNEKTVRILDVVSRTTGRLDTEIPTSTGTCVVNGFVRGAPTAGEFIGAIYKFKQVDNFYLRLFNTSLSAGSSTILDRIENVRPILAKADGKILRKFKRDVGGQNGYEAAYSMLSDEDPARGRIMIDRFVFELNSKEGSARKPRVSVELFNGESIPNEEENVEEYRRPIIPAPLSSTAVEAMWDRIIPTIRVRPSGFSHI